MPDEARLGREQYVRQPRDLKDYTDESGGVASRLRALGGLTRPLLTTAFVNRGQPICRPSGEFDALRQKSRSHRDLVVPSTLRPPVTSSTKLAVNRVHRPTRVHLKSPYPQSYRASCAFRAIRKLLYQVFGEPEE